MRRTIAVICLLTMVGCANGEAVEPAPTSGTTEVVTTEPPTTTSITPQPTTTTTAPSTGSPTTGDDSGITSCVVGEWELDTGEFEAQVETFYDDAGMSSDVSITGGRVLLHLEAGGLFVGGYDELMVDVSLGDALPDLTVTFGGVVSGEYSVDGDSLVLVPDDQSTFAATVEVGGVSVSPAGELGLGDVDLFTESVSDVVCENGLLRIEPAAGLGPASVWRRR